MMKFDWWPKRGFYHAGLNAETQQDSFALSKQDGLLHLKLGYFTQHYHSKVKLYGR